MTAGASATLCRLRQAVAKIEGQETDLGIASRTLALGVQTIDARLQGGLAPASLHEIAPASARDLGAAVGFAFALAARAADDGRKHALDSDRLRCRWRPVISMVPAAIFSDCRQSGF